MKVVIPMSTLVRFTFYVVVIALVIGLAAGYRQPAPATTSTPVPAAEDIRMAPARAADK
jgi:hypothetical protein